MSTLFRGRVHGVDGGDDGVLVEEGVITWIGAGDPPRRPKDQVYVEPGGMIAPGFIDLQVNGFQGHVHGQDAANVVFAEQQYRHGNLSPRHGDKATR